MSIVRHFIRKLLTILIATILANQALGQAKYDPKDNSVTLNTPILAEGIDIGFIEIKSKDYITIKAISFDKDSKKMIGMCGINPSLGLLIINEKVKLGTSPPKVTSVEQWESESATTKAGWVRSFILKGDDALDLMDLLLEYRSVGFMLSGTDCAETDNVTNGRLIVIFETRGLERAMNRIK
jgi:hypothetical protein